MVGKYSNDNDIYTVSQHLVRLVDQLSINNEYVDEASVKVVLRNNGP